MRIEMKDGSVTSLTELAHQVETAGSFVWIPKIGPLRNMLWSPLKPFGFDRLSRMASVLENCVTRRFVETVGFDLYRGSHSRKSKSIGRTIMVGLIAESVVDAIRPYVLSEEDQNYLARTGLRFGFRLLHSMQNTSEVPGLAIRVRNSIGLEARRKAERVV